MNCETSCSDVSIDHIGLKKFNVFPNPSNGLVYIEIETANLVTLNCYVKNAIGQVIYDYQKGEISGLFNHKIDLTSVEKGVYFIELEIDGQNLYRRLVIQ